MLSHSRLTSVGLGRHDGQPRIRTSMNCSLTPLEHYLPYLLMLRSLRPGITIGSLYEQLFQMIAGAIVAHQRSKCPPYFKQ